MSKIPPIRHYKFTQECFLFRYRITGFVQKYFNECKKNEVLFFLQESDMKNVAFFLDYGTANS